MRLIDADELKEKLSEVGWYDLYDEDKAIACIDKMPTIDPVKHGHWIDIDFETDRCSECGHDFEFGSGWYFCPLCGAEMDGESE